MTDDEVIIILSSDDDDDEAEDERLIRQRRADRRSTPKVSSKATCPESAGPPSIPSSDTDCHPGKSLTGPSCSGLRRISSTNHASEDENEVRDASPSRPPVPRAPDADWDNDKLRPFQCKFCNGKFLSTNLYEKHMNLHEDNSQSIGPPVPQYECVICNRRFLYSESRNSHMMLKHADRFIPPIVEPGDKIMKRKESPSIQKPRLKKFKIEKQAKKIQKSDKHEVDQKPVITTHESDVSVEKTASVSSVVHSAGNSSLRTSAAVKVNRRPARLNVDFTRDMQTERECIVCHSVFRDPLTHQFHSPCFDETPFRQSGGYKCPSCPKSGPLYDSIYKLREHSAQHRIPPFACSYCRTRTQLLYEMELHVAQKHSEKLQ